MSKNEKMQNVTILSRMDITTYPKLNQPEKIMMITYIAAGMPPHTLNIPKKDYTKAKEKALIKTDIAIRLKSRPETYQV